MIKKLKIWFCNKFLPAWCREELLEENKRLIRQISEMKQEIVRLNAYVAGMEGALKLERRIKIYTGEVRANGRIISADGQQNT